MSRYRACDLCGCVEDCFYCMECGQEMCRACFGPRGGDCKECHERMEDGDIPDADDFPDDYAPGCGANRFVTQDTQGC